MDNISKCEKNSPYKVEINEVLGRHLIATRKIKPGEILIKEAPLICGPAQLTAPVCLGVCGGVIRPPAIRPCELCGWPMCGAEQCKTSSLHEPECFYTRNRGNKITISNYVFPHPNYQCLTALRILYQRDHNPQLWEKLIKLESHCVERKKTEKYENDRVAIAQFLHRFFKLENVFTEEEIMKVCGVLQVNGHEVPLSEPPYVAIYDKASMLEHNCRPNCCKSFTSNGEILIHAAVDILPGEHLSICYTDSLWGTPNRRHYLLETKYFGCSCDRCIDPTEFGTFFSAIKCNKKECSGVLLPRTFIVDPEEQTLWYCSICTHTTTSKQVENILERIGRDLNAMKKGDVKSCKLFLEYYGKILHHNHYYLTDVRLALTQITGLNTDEDVEDKIKNCTKLIKLLETLNPAELRARGSILFELHAATAEYAKRKASNNGTTGACEFERMLTRSREALADAVVLLQHEPRELPEGQILIQGQINLKNMDEVLRKLHTSLGDTPV